MMTISIMTVVVLTLASGLGALLSGITGLGGGTILIAVIYACGLSPTVAVPVHAAVQLVSNASRTVAYVRHVDWRALRWFLVGAMPAPFLVAPLLAQTNADVIRLAMAGFIVLSLWPKVLDALRLKGRSGMCVAGVLAGGLGSIFAASGTVIAPLFRRAEWSRQTTVGTLAVCQAFAHLAKIVAFSTIGFEMRAYAPLVLPMMVAVFVGTWLGRQLHDYVSERGFDMAFRVILCVLAVKLGWDGASGLLASSHH